MSFHFFLLLLFLWSLLDASCDIYVEGYFAALCAHTLSVLLRPMEMLPYTTLTYGEWSRVRKCLKEGRVRFFVVVFMGGGRGTRFIFPLFFFLSHPWKSEVQLTRVVRGFTLIALNTGVCDPIAGVCFDLPRLLGVFIFVGAHFMHAHSLPRTLFISFIYAVYWSARLSLKISAF